MDAHDEGHRVSLKIPNDDQRVVVRLTTPNIILNGSACTNLQSVTLTQYQFIYACTGVKICVVSCPSAN